MKEKFGIYTDFLGVERIIVYNTHKELDNAFDLYTKQGRKDRNMKKVKLSWKVIK